MIFGNVRARIVVVAAGVVVLVFSQFAGAAELIPKLRALLVNGGQLYLTSLVSNGRYIGDCWWLGTLYKTGSSSALEAVWS